MKKMMIIAGMILMLVLIGFLGFSLYQNHRLKKSFKLNSGHPAALEYLNHDRMEDMDMERIRMTAFTYTRPAVRFPDYDVKVPCDIRYYADAALKKESKVIPKGTVIHVRLPENSDDDLGRGIFSLPTFQKGVRYVRPFTVAPAVPALPPCHVVRGLLPEDLQSHLAGLAENPPHRSLARGPHPLRHHLRCHLAGQ